MISRPLFCFLQFLSEIHVDCPQLHFRVHFLGYNSIQRNGNPIQINGNFSKETGAMQRNRKPKNATTPLKMQPLRLRVSLHYWVSYIFRLFGSKETGAFSVVSLYAVFPCFTVFYKTKNATILYQSLRLDVRCVD